MVVVIGVGARGIKEQDAEGVARPAIVAEEALKAGLVYAGLFVDACNSASSGIAGSGAQTRMISLGASQNGIDEGGGSGAEIERDNGASVTGFQERLGFRRGEEQLVGAVGVVVQEFDTREERAGGLPVGDSLGANEIAPGIGAEMGSIDSAKNAVPISVVALRAHEELARLRPFIGGL